MIEFDIVQLDLNTGKSRVLTDAECLGIITAYQNKKLFRSIVDITYSYDVFYKGYILKDITKLIYPSNKKQCYFRITYTRAGGKDKKIVYTPPFDNCFYLIFNLNQTYDIDGDRVALIHHILRTNLNLSLYQDIEDFIDREHSRREE